MNFLLWLLKVKEMSEKLDTVDMASELEELRITSVVA